MPRQARHLERLHIRAWPALEARRIDGWLWRYSGGGSQRANSVSTIDYTGNDLNGALERVEALYRAKGVPARFHTSGLTAPAGLVSRLAARGYIETETTTTMVAVAQPAAPPSGVTVSADPPPDWLDVYLEAVTESRRTVNRDILRRIPDPRAFFLVRDGGRAVSTALGVVLGGHAVAECVATRAGDRGHRHADTSMRALMSWAASLGAHTMALQVVSANGPALALYRRLGFAAVDENRFWMRPDIGGDRTVPARW